MLKRTISIVSLRRFIISPYVHHPGDKNSTRPLVITSEIKEGRVILSKALILQDECFEKNYSGKSYYSIMFLIAYAFKGQVHVFVDKLKL